MTDQEFTPSSGLSYQMTRRRLLGTLGISTALGLGANLFPGQAFASARTDKRLVVIILRGGMDGLAALAPYGDPAYRQTRGDLAIDQDALLKIDPFFGLHPSLSPLASLYKKGEMIALPASATPYRNRSHFDAQNVLELGSDKPHALNSGWLNRLVGAINEREGNTRSRNKTENPASPSGELGLAFGSGLPLIMRGDHDVNAWSPSAMPDTSDDYMSLVQRIYGNDPLLSKNLNKALDLQARSEDMTDNEQKMAKQNNPNKSFFNLASLAGRWLGDPDGPRIATLELGGWDTHARQGTEGGRLANNLGILARGITSIKQEMIKSADQSNYGSSWSKTVVVAMTEFGRTAHPNGNLGTDHGTAGTAFLFGGALKSDGGKGRIIHNWPGLAKAQLYENRDLNPTTDLRAIMLGLLSDHYGLSQAVLTRDIYPGSQGLRPFMGLV